MKHILLILSVSLIVSSGARADWIDELRDTCDWLAVIQNGDGSLPEGENFSYVYLVMVPRAMMCWSHYGMVTGDLTRYQNNINLGWSYLSANRPDLETTLYTALEACGLTLIAGSIWRENTGDTSQDLFMDDLVTFINGASINPAIPTQVHAFSQGIIGIGMLGDQTGNAQYKNDATSGAQSIQSIIEGDTAFLSNEVGEESGGMSFTAIVRYAFSDGPTRKTWIETYAPLLDSCITNGLYSNAHTGWYAYAQYLAWDYAAEISARTHYYNAITKLNAEDIENDGAINNRYGGRFIEDKTWATEVRYWALTHFGPSQDFAIAASNTGVPAGGTLFFDYGIANNESTNALAFLVAFIDIPTLGPRYLGVFALQLPGGFAFGQSQVPLRIANGSPTGPWTLRVSVYNSAGQLQEEERMTFNVF